MKIGDKVAVLDDDIEGIIIATNLKGSDLADKLSELLD